MHSIYGKYSRETCLSISTHDIFSKMPFTVRANTAAVYPGFHGASMCDYILWRDAHPLQLITSPPLPSTLIRFSDSSSVPIYTPGWREALGESKVSLNKEHLTLDTLTSVSTFSILFSRHFLWY